MFSCLMTWGKVLDVINNQNIRDMQFGLICVKESVHINVRNIWKY